MKTLGVVMDPIGAIKPYKDTTLALLLAAAKRGFALRYFEPQDLWLRGGIAWGRARDLTVRDDNDDWYRFDSEPRAQRLGELDVILMRVDPPYDLEYVTTTWILDRAMAQGAVVVNRPDGLRDCNEKAFAAWFPELTPPTLISRNGEELRAFHAEHRDVIYKPLNGMGGQGVFRVPANGYNLGSVIEQLTGYGHHTIVAQKFVPEVVDGDKRILIVDGEPVPYCLARLAKPGELRANLAAGGHGEARPLTARDREIATRVGPELRRHGLLFVGLDVIGDYLTEINVTSPTCSREIDAACGTDIAGQVIDKLPRANPAR
ncbi:MAG TPA: glutathione synthase [Nevskiaceae bacterium]